MPASASLKPATEQTQEQERPRLLHEQDDLWVFYKPSGFAVHPTNDPDIPDLISWAFGQDFSEQKMSPIHRIDRETSGIVMCSPDPSVRKEASAWFVQEKVKKEYLALVYGETRKRGNIDKPLFDRRRKKPLSASTSYERLEVLAGFSYLQIQPSTGRKHQIRQHMQMIGHSIIGDTRYRPKRFRRVPAFPNRLWLHAHKISLPNGWEFSAPLPLCLQQHLDYLRNFKPAT